jgi:phosphatidylglycerol---prolipoprotein diacylglyceryl transferase
MDSREASHSLIASFGARNPARHVYCPAVLPYLHLGPLTLPTYGLLAATGLAVAYFVLRADVRRRQVALDPEMIIGVAGIAGVVGAKLYHLLESPHEFFAHPFELFFSRTGLAWFGGLLGGFFTLVFLARHFRVPVLTMFDLASPAAALGYGVGRLGCLTSGDGDYGIPTSLPWGMSFPNGIVPTTARVHPTPIYEFLAALVIFWILWKLGAAVQGTGKNARPARPAGYVFAWYLLLTGLSRFLVEFIRINPRIYFGMSNAQVMGLVSFLAGAILLVLGRRASAPVDSHS